MDPFLETLISKIKLANDLYRGNQPFRNQSKLPEMSKVYVDTYNEYKSRKIAERELRRPWSKMSANCKIIVLLNFLQEFETKHPGVNLNAVRYDALLNIDENKGLDLKMDYDCSQGVLHRIYGYKFVDKQVIKTDDLECYITNKVQLSLKRKTAKPDEADKTIAAAAL